MHIKTIEEDYEYRMKNLMDKFVKQYELQNYKGDELQDKIWNEYSAEFGKAVLEDMYNFSGNELFGELNEDEE